MVWRICWAYLSRTLCAPMSGAFCKLGTAKVPKAEVRVSVKAEAAPLSKEATNNFTSARLSVLSSFPRNPALPSVISKFPCQRLARDPRQDRKHSAPGRLARPTSSVRCSRYVHAHDQPERH